MAGSVPEVRQKTLMELVRDLTETLRETNDEIEAFEAAVDSATDSVISYVNLHSGKNFGPRRDDIRKLILAAFAGPEEEED